jgi:signal transduction histidine kinase/CheY-like chemotaxis protein
VLDYNIPGGDGLTLLRALRAQGLQLPVVMLTGHGDEQVAVELMKSGASDYIPKAQLTPDRLAKSVRYAVDLARAAEATRRAEAERTRSAARTAQLQEVTAQLAAALSTDDVARLFVTQLREALGADAAWIALAAGEGAELVALASTGYDAERIGGFDRVALDAPLPAADIMRDGVPRFYSTAAELVADYPALARTAGLLGQGAMAILPLELGGEPFGLMSLGFREARDFPAEDRAFAIALARQCAQALERARLYEQERRSRTEAEVLASRLAGAALAVTRQPSPEAVIAEITRQARTIIGAHQAATSIAARGDGEPAIGAVSLSEKYSAWRGYDSPPIGSGLYRLVLEGRAPLRLTEGELEEHPAWRGFREEWDRHPPLRGWLAAPLIASDGSSLGLIQLSDKEEGEFTAADESILVQLAQMAAGAIENVSLFAAAEAARAEAESANRAKSEFLARMSHDLRTPLNAIGGYAQLLEMGVHGPVTQEQRAALDRIQRSKQHLLALINDILDFARIEAGKVQVDLREIPVPDTLREVGELFHPEAAARGILLDVVPDAGDVLAHGDRERLMQVLTNLTTNALKFTPAGGRVRLEAAEAGEWIEIRVADTGVGIPSDRLEAIFNPFVQGRDTTEERREGVGLGLAISREFARLMGGDLLVESVEGEGSVFTVRLRSAAPLVDVR